jgi:hypothetical protein
MKKIIFSFLFLVFSYSLVFSNVTCGVIGVDWYSSTLNAPFTIRHEEGCLVFNNKMWLIGGGGPNWPNEKDVWSSTDGVNWTLENGGAAFGPRGAGGYLVFDNGTGLKMWIIGGEHDGEWQKDVWYSSNGVDWNMATGNAAFGIKECQASYVYNNKMWVAGGYNGSNMNDVWWSSNGADWYQATANAPWSPRSYPEFAVYDNGTGSKMWIIGGGDWGGGTGYSDVWSSTDGVNWTQATASFRPRFQGRAEVFDGKLWVIGGTENSVKLNDAWYTTDGAIWTEATGSAAFSARCDGATCVYDNRMWYLAGIQQDSIQYNDVWYTCGSSPVLTPGSTPSETPVYTATPVPTNTPPVVLSTATPVPVPTVNKGDSTCYPTKAKDHLKIVFNTEKKADVKIYVYDISGKLVKTIDMKTGATPDGKLYNVQLDVRGFEQGVYYYVIQGKCENGELINFKSKKFIVTGSK